MIVHLVSNRWNSAIAEYAVHCTKALSLLGEKQVFVGLKGSPAVRRVLASSLENCTVAEVDRFSLTAMPDVMRVIDPATKVIFVYGGAETFLSKWIKIARPGVKVIRFRGDDRDASKAAFDIRQQWSQGHVDLFLSPSSYLTEKLSGDAVRRGSDRAMNMASLIRTVEHGIDTARIHRKPERDPGAGRRKDLVILGRLDPVKGHAHFFQIFGKLLQLASPEEFCLHVIGEPANLSLVHLEDAARSAGLISGKDIIFTTGRVEDLSRLLSSACAGVISSSGSEIICRVAEEFLVCGTPVAVSGVGSLGVFARSEDGTELGFNYGPLRSPEVETELLAFCRKSAAESAQTRSLRARYATERFSIETMARQLRKALDDLSRGA